MGGRHKFTLGVDQNHPRERSAVRELRDGGQAKPNGHGRIETRSAHACYSSLAGTASVARQASHAYETTKLPSRACPRHAAKRPATSLCGERAPRSLATFFRPLNPGHSITSSSRRDLDGAMVSTQELVSVTHGDTGREEEKKAVRETRVRPKRVAFRGRWACVIG